MSIVERRTAAEILGVSITPGNARERLIDRAIDLFYLHGFNAVGIDQIIKEAGVTKTTFYKHFESKDDLVVQAVKRRDRWEAESLDRALRAAAGDDPRARLLAVFDVMHTWFNSPDFRGCMFINAGAEFPNRHDPVHQAAADYKHASRDKWRDLASQAGAMDPETFADRFALLVEGTLILRQVHDRNDAALVAKHMAQMLVDGFIPEAAMAH
ncbi:MAG TPA: TetR/AcrR family transcriptional regulator [Tepidisphaeraceae bacterium]|jgi:AcrR family transcriptional regulator